MGSRGKVFWTSLFFLPKLNLYNSLNKFRDHNPNCWPMSCLRNDNTKTQSFKEDWVVFRESFKEKFKGDSKVSNTCSMDVLKEFQGSFKNVLRKFQVCLRKVSNVFQEKFPKYQPSGAGGTRSPPATTHRLQHLTTRLIQNGRQGYWTLRSTFAQ